MKINLWEKQAAVKPTIKSTSIQQIIVYKGQSKFPH